MTSADEIAARLAKARADRTPIGSLSAEIDGFSLDAAYEVQRVLRLEARPLAGWMPCGLRRPTGRSSFPAWRPLPRPGPSRYSSRPAPQRWNA